MIFFGLDKSPFKVYEKKIYSFYIIFYIENFSIFLAPQKKDVFLEKNHLKHKIQKDLATVRSTIINFYAKIKNRGCRNIFFEK